MAGLPGGWAATCVRPERRNRRLAKKKNNETEEEGFGSGRPSDSGGGERRTGGRTRSQGSRGEGERESSGLGSPDEPRAKSVRDPKVAGELGAKKSRGREGVREPRDSRLN
ncbi:hypothetical protein CDL15_Pgr010685 [Punica granatum]|uniref:Uncharacterized protein n=1 Tax=Punica granatum TaxID=22663 RepID=A0A218XN17_PUNGR|nr:hypothetical protein CDL15_Pgr010685 [Punica granatum]